jgi:ferredoxin
MTHAVTERCIKCKYMHCVEVCPVDCFHEGKNMLVIDPDVCIDCGACLPLCPAKAIVSETDPVVNDWIEHNSEYAGRWPTTTTKRPELPDAEIWRDVSHKLRDYFNPEAFF